MDIVLELMRTRQYIVFKALENYPYSMAHQDSISLCFSQKVKEGVSTLDIPSIEVMQKP